MDLSIEEKLTLDTIENQKRVTDRALFETKDLVVFENGKYVFKCLPSSDLMEHMFNSLTTGEVTKCIDELEGLKQYA